MILAGAGIAIALAAQVGPVSLLIVRSVLRGGRALLVGLAMAGAVALVDILYATVGLAGAGRLLDAGGLRFALGSVERCDPRGHRRADAVARAARTPGARARRRRRRPRQRVRHRGRRDRAQPPDDRAVDCGFAALVVVAARRLGRRLLAAVDVAIGAGLVVFGAVLGYRAAN